jgi:PIN domain nuclease of toxin-antitoxin system
MFLLDTHILLWCLEASPRLKPQTKKLIQDPNQIILVSAVSIWEIIVKKMLGKLQIPDNLQEVIEKTGFKSLPMTLEDALVLESLPPIHADPFDRLLIAQAKRHGLTFITHDIHCAAYPIQSINPLS